MANRLTYKELEQRVQELEGELAECIRLEEYLRGDGGQIQALMETVLDGVGVTDLEGNISYVSPRMINLYGHKNREEIVGRNIAEFIAPADHCRVPQTIQETLQKGMIRGIHYTFLKRDGSCFIGELSLSLMRDSNDRPTSFIGVVRDITERKRMEEALLESERLHRLVAESMSDIIWTSDMDLRFTYVSPSVESFVGYAPEELIGKTIIEHLTPSSAELAAKVFLEEVAQNDREPSDSFKSRTMELQRFHKDGSLVWGEVSTTFLKDAKGRSVALLGVTRDITERKQAEGKLRESERRYAMAEEIADLGHWQGDFIENKYVWSSGLFRITGIAPHKGAQTLRAFLRLVHPDDRQWLKNRVDASLSEGGVFSQDYRIIHENGEERFIHSSWETLLDDSGKPTKSFGILQDITELKRLERELNETRRVEALRTLAGGIAHDFNNILTAIMTNISMAKTWGDLDDDISQMLTDAETASLRAKSLSSQLLAFATGGLPIKRPVSLTKIVRDTAQFTLSGSNVRCECFLPDDLWLVDVDEGQIGQVMQNLIINADQAMPEGGTIRVRAENVLLEGKDRLGAKAGKYVRISVEDKGHGIGEKQLQRIFDPFFSTKEKGRGLGLATASSIVRRHDGDIRVESEVGVGTTFHLLLPASEKSLLSIEKEKGKPLRGFGNILLVDDEEIIRTSAGRGLEELGYEVEVAKDGAEGIALYEKAMGEKRPFDVVIMDLTIPGGMGGKETIRRLKEIEPDARVVVSSGYSDDPVMSNFREYGFSGVVVKPYRINELAEAIRYVLHAP